MKFVIKKEELVKKLAEISGLVGTKGAMPVLNHFLLAAGKDQCSIQATDLETYLKMPLIAAVEMPGKICLPGRKLFEIVKELDGGDVEFQAEGEGWMRVKANGASFRLACLSASDYPAWPDMGEAEKITMPVAILSEMLDKSIYAAGESDTRYTLNGILFHLKPEGKQLALVGTDGHRMAVISKLLEAVSGEEKKVIIHRKAASELRKFLAGEGDVSLSFGKNHTLFSLQGVEFLTRLIEGAYPNYDQVIPTASEKKAVFDPETLVKALRRVSIMSRERANAITIDTALNTFTVSSSNPDLGEAKDVVPVSFSGESLTIGFNAKYLIDALNAIGNGEKREIVFEFQDPLSPTLLTASGDDSYRCVVMPMRV